MKLFLRYYHHVDFCRSAGSGGRNRRNRLIFHQHTHSGRQHDKLAQMRAKSDTKSIEFDNLSRTHVRYIPSSITMRMNSLRWTIIKLTGGYSIRVALKLFHNLNEVHVNYVFFPMINLWYYSSPQNGYKSQKWWEAWGSRTTAYTIVKLLIVSSPFSLGQKLSVCFFHSSFDTANIVLLLPVVPVSWHVNVNNWSLHFQPTPSEPYSINL